MVLEQISASFSDESDKDDGNAQAEAYGNVKGALAVVKMAGTHLFLLLYILFLRLP